MHAFFRDSVFSLCFEQAMSDHFDHYKRPPSRDNSVDRYSRAASRLSGGSRQSSVEKSQQVRRGGGDDMSDKGFSPIRMAGGPDMAFSSAALHAQPQPFEDIILRQRNIGQEIVPSPVGQPKRTESLYVNPNSARKDTKLKVSTLKTRSCISENCCGGGVAPSGSGGVVPSVRKPRLLPPPPIPRRQ